MICIPQRLRCQLFCGQYRYSRTASSGWSIAHLLVLCASMTPRICRNMSAMELCGQGSDSYPVRTSKLMRNKAAIPGGDSIEERGTSIPRGRGDSDAIVECRRPGHRAITVEGDLGYTESPPEATTFHLSLSSLYSTSSISDVHGLGSSFLLYSCFSRGPVTVGHNETVSICTASRVIICH